MHCWFLTLIPSDLYGTLNPEPASGRAASVCFSSPLLPAGPQPAPASEHSQRVCPISTRPHTTKESASGSLAVVSDSATPWTVAHQAPLSMELSRREYWSGLPFPYPGDLSDSGVEPRSPTLQADSLPLSYQGSPTSPRDPLNDKGCVRMGTGSRTH